MESCQTDPACRPSRDRERRRASSAMQREPTGSTYGLQLVTTRSRWRGGSSTTGQALSQVLHVARRLREVTSAGRRDVLAGMPAKTGHIGHHHGCRTGGSTVVTFGAAASRHEGRREVHHIDGDESRPFHTCGVHRPADDRSRTTAPPPVSPDGDGQGRSAGPSPHALRGLAPTHRAHRRCAAPRVAPGAPTPSAGKIRRRRRR